MAMKKQIVTLLAMGTRGTCSLTLPSAKDCKMLAVDGDAGKVTLLDEVN